MSGDAKMTAALLGRPTHYYIVETVNESWRFRHSSTAAASRIRSRERSKRAPNQAPAAEEPP